MEKNNQVEDLMIYKQYLSLIYYTEEITTKFPKSEKQSLVATIKNTTYHGIQSIIKTYNVFLKEEKLKYLKELDSDLKFLKVLIRVSYKREFISNKNFTAWVKKITNICNLLGGWIKSCQKR